MTIKLDKNEKVIKTIKNATSLSGRKIIQYVLIVNVITGKTRAQALVEM